MEKNSSSKDLSNKKNTNEQETKNSINSTDLKLSEKFCLNNNFVPTKKAIERLVKLYNYISKGNPILISGETGTSKSFSVEIICRYIFEKSEKKQYKNSDDDMNLNEEEKIYIKYDLNSDIEISDLIQKLVIDKNYDIKIVYGPFYKAFKYGFPLILEGIDLANEDVLECIESALDSKMINKEIPKIGLIKQEMKEGFCLIVIQRINRLEINSKDYKRLSPKFLSHFKRIDFTNFDGEELIEIATGLMKSLSPNTLIKNPKQILTLVMVHSKIISKLKKSFGKYFFTIREIITCIKAFAERMDNSKVFKIIYGARLKNEEKKGIFQLTDDFNNYIPEEMKKEIYQNKELNEVLESAILSLNLGKNIIITGEKGSGKSTIARWIAKIFNIDNHNNKDEYYHYICTSDTKYSDLFGDYHEEKKDNEIYYEWKNGFLVDSIKNGKIVILDNLQEINFSRIEGLNSLLDIQFENILKNDYEEKKFVLQGNPIESSISIHKNFRIIGICDVNKASKISNAFTNRFLIVNLENQIDNITIDNLKSLLKILFNQNKEEKKVNNELNFEEENPDIKKTSSFEEELFIDIDAENEGNNEKKEKFKQFIQYLAEMLYKEIKNTEIIFTIKDISRLCYSLKRFLKIKYFHNIDSKKLIDFIHDILFKEDQGEIDKEIKEAFLSYLKNNNKNFYNNDFIFQNNSKLENLVLILYASFLINLPACVIGPKGIGKTSILQFMSELIKEQNNYLFYPYYKQNKLEKIYQEIIKEYYNPLIKYAKEGSIVIADEADLTTKYTTDSILPFLDPTLNTNLFIPELNKSIDIDKNFYFLSSKTHYEKNLKGFYEQLLRGKMVCKEEKDLFTNIKNNIKIIKYPELNDKMIIDIYNKKNYNMDERNITSNEENSSFLKFIFKYNEIIDENEIDLKHWEMSDIDKILKKINDSSFKEKFLNFNYYHFIYFYFFSSIPKKELVKEYKYNNIKTPLKILLHDIFITIFNLNERVSKELQNNFFSKPLIDKKNKCIMKGNIGLKINDDNIFASIKQLNNNDKNLSNFFDDYFKLNLISNEKTFIIMGPSGYRKELLKLYFKKNNFKIIHYNQKSEFDKLLNKIKETSSNDSRSYEEIDNNIIDYDKLISLSKNYPIIYDLIDNTMKVIIVNNEYKLMVKRNSILWYILKQEPILLKNIHKYPFEKSESINLLIFINNWFYKNFSLAINLIGICQEFPLKEIHKNILSDFSIFCVGEHEFDININIINYYAQFLQIPDTYTNLFVSLYKSKVLENIKVVKNFMNIFCKMTKNNSDNNLNQNYIYLTSYLFNRKKNEIEKDNKNNENALYKSNNYIFSSLSKLKIQILKENISESLTLQKNLIFTSLFNKLLDLIHLAICTNIPLILDGYPGEGKRTAINYFKSLLNYKIKNIYITPYLSINDFEQKINFVEENNDNTILVFHNINDANAEVFSAVYDIFNNKDNHKLIIIGLINENYEFQENLSLTTTQSQYEKLFQKCIYYKINNFHHYNNVNEIISHNNIFDSGTLIRFNKIGNNFSLNDIDKYIKLKNCLKLRDKFINDIIAKKHLLPYINNEFNKSPFDSLKWIFKGCTQKEVSIQINNESFILNSNDCINLQKSLNTLSPEQKKSFISLCISYLSNIPFILKGPTGVGKSYLIQLLAKILGKKLFVYQISKDNNNYKLLNQLYLKDKSKEDKRDILQRLEENGGKQIENELQDKEEESKLINSQDEKTKTGYSLEDNFEEKNSTFLSAIKNGDWVLLDGIENCLNFVSQIIEILYPEEKINDLISDKGFRLFITYNSKNINDIPSYVIDKCLVYDLIPFIENKKSVYEIIYGFLRNLNNFKNENIISDIGKKLTNIHMMLYEKINTNSNCVNKITERTLFNFCETLSLEKEDKQNLNDKIIQHFSYHYFPFCNEKDSNEFIEIIKENLKPANNQKKENLSLSSIKMDEVEKFCTIRVNGTILTYNPNKVKINSFTKGVGKKLNIDFKLKEEKEKPKTNKSHYFTHKIIDTLDSNEIEKDYIVNMDNEPNKTYILKKIKINNKNNEQNIVYEIEKLMSLNSIYICRIISYYLECDESNNEFLCVFIENNQKVKTFLKNSVPINIIWTIFFKAIAGIMYFGAKELNIKNFDLKYLYIDENNNIKFDVILFISEYIYESNIFDLDVSLPINSLRAQLFKDNLNNNISSEEIIFDNYLKNLLNLVLYEENMEIILFYFNSLKYFFADNNIKNISFEIFDLTCSKCQILPELYLKDKKVLLTKCLNCFLVRNEKIENYRNNMVNEKFNIKSLFLIKKNDKYLKYLEEFPKALKYKYLYVKKVIDDLLKKSKDNNLYKEILNDRVINILKIYINDFIIYSNLVHLYLNVFLNIQSNNFKFNLIIQYENVLEIIHEYFSEKEQIKFQQSIDIEKEIFFILYNNISENEINEMKSILNDYFQPNKAGISVLEKNKLFIEKNILYSYSLNKYKAIEKIKEPEKYININELLNNVGYLTAQIYDKSNRNFILGVLAKCIESNGIKVYVSKNEDENLNNIELASMQSLLLSFSNQIKYEFHFEFGELINNKIMKDENYRNGFINNLKTIIARQIDIKEQNIILKYNHLGSIVIDVFPMNISPEEEKKLKLLLKDKELHITKIIEKPLLEALEISPKIFNSLGDRYDGWGKNEIRGGENYIPPEEGWIGIGLNVKGKYDNGNDSWLNYKNQEGEFSIAYLGLNNFLNNNINTNDLSQDLFKVIKNKLYRDQKNLKSKSVFKGKCGDGICVFQNPRDAENFAGVININQKMMIKVMLMCRVNSKKIRQPKNYEKFWILNPTPDEIRPYRILIKKIPISPLIGTLNDNLITSVNPIKYITSAINSRDNSFYSLLIEKFPQYTRFNGQKLNNDFSIIKFYTSEYYKYLNNYLRNKEEVDLFTEKELSSWIYCLQLALERNINVSKEITVFRGVKEKFPKEIIECSKFYIREFISCSTSLNQAKDLAGPRGTVMIITIKNNGANGEKNYCFSLKDISQEEDDEEILISSHCYYTLNKIEKETDLDYVYLTCEGYYDLKIENGEIIFSNN